MKQSHLKGALGVILSTLITLPAHAALIGVLPATSGGTDYQAYYDDQLDITWTANANINSFGVWDTQTAWAAGLDIDGVTGWRLPNADVNGDGIIIDCRGGGVTGCADNEMGFLFWEEGITADAPGPFSNAQSNTYWSATEYGPGLAGAFSSGFAGVGGVTAVNLKDTLVFAWAVRSGNVSAVPVPAAVWLFGSGLLGLVGVARRKRA